MGRISGLVGSGPMTALCPTFSAPRVRKTGHAIIGYRFERWIRERGILVALMETAMCISGRMFGPMREMRIGTVPRVAQRGKVSQRMFGGK